VNPATGDPILKQVEKSSPDNDVFLATIFARNSRGQIEGIAQQDRGGTRRIVNIRYDSLEGIYPISVRDGLDHQTNIVTHSGLGLVGEIVEPNGASTRFTYDRFGRQRSMKAPGSGGASWTYSRGLESGSAAADERFVLSVTENFDGGGQSKTDFNRLGQQIRRERTLMDPLKLYGGTNPYFTAYSNLTYNAVGALQTVSRPKAVGAPVGALTTYAFDNLFRPTRVSRPSGTEAGGGTWSASYSGRVTTITDEVGHQTRLTESPSGLVTLQESRNDAGSWVPTSYEYGHFNVLRFVRRTPAAGGTPIQTEMVYDILGRVTSLIDPDAKTRQTRYNAFGEFRSTTDAKLGVTTYTRDALGREEFRTTPDGDIDTVWDAGTGGLGQISQTIRGNVRRVYDYDLFGRLIRSSLLRTNFNPIQSYPIEMDYHATSGRVSRLRYPPYSGTSRVEVQMDYDPNSGELARVTDTRSGGAVYWQRQKNDPDGQIELELFGNGIQTTRTYFAETGRLSTIVGKLSASTQQSLAYRYWNDGSLKVRSNLLSPAEHERFEYDALDRIKRWVQASATGTELTGGWKVNYAVNDLGNLTRRHSITTAGGTQTLNNTYDRTGNAGPHALTTSFYGAYTYDLNGNQTGRPNGETITYSAEDLPRTISGVASRAATFLYDADGSRVEKVKTASGEVTTYLDDLYEKRVINSSTSEHLYYILGPEGPVAQVTRPVVDRVPGTESTRYLHPDHLGTIERSTCGPGVSSCNSGSIHETRRYDPFGNRLSSTTSKHLPTTLGEAVPPSGIRLGFTGHEDDFEQSLINMKGRLYDPRTARFLTPDPVAQDPFEEQSYNRYAYVLNNPLKYIDPSGFEGERPPWYGRRSFLPSSNDIRRFFGAGPPPTSPGSGSWHRPQSPFGPPPVTPPPPAPPDGPAASPVATPAPPPPAPVPGPAGIGATGGEVRGSGSQGGLPFGLAAPVPPFVRYSSIPSVGFGTAAGLIGGTAVVGSTAGGVAAGANAAAGAYVALATRPGIVIAAQEVGLGVGGMSLGGGVVARACFVAGTPIVTPRGLVPIEKIAAGDSVWSYDGTTDTWGWAMVTETFVHAYEGSVYRLEIGDVSIEVTGNHPICVASGDALEARSVPRDVGSDPLKCGGGGRWVEAGDIVAGDAVVRASGLSNVRRATAYQASVSVYNISVASSHTYAVSADGALVHNKPLPNPQGLWTITKAGTERAARHKTFGMFYKSKSDGLWWSVDQAGHGGSKWKVFEETGSGLQWRADADEFGDFIIGKHKGPEGMSIRWKELIGVNL
jgi:RHS repeat-associated protein